VIDIIPVVERVFYHCCGAAAFIYGFPEQAAVRRIRRITFGRSGAGEVTDAIVECERC
jgi:Fe-S oxidoreductase